MILPVENYSLKNDELEVFSLAITFYTRYFSCEFIYVLYHRHLQFNSHFTRLCPQFGGGRVSRSCSLWLAYFTATDATSQQQTPLPKTQLL